MNKFAPITSVIPGLFGVKWGVWDLGLGFLLLSTHTVVRRKLDSRRGTLDNYLSSFSEPEGRMARTISALLVVAVLLLGVLPGCGGGSSEPTVGPPTILNPEDLVPDVQVQIVDHNWRIAGQTNDILSSDPILSLISSATSSLDIAIPRIDRQEVVAALVNEAASGTQIRILTEKAYYDSDVYRAFYDQLEDVTRTKGNLTIHTDTEGLPRMMHARFMVIDHARVITGSYEWESVASEHSFGDVISILNTGIAAAFTTQFNQMFVEGRFGPNKRDDTVHTFLVGSRNGTVEVYFGPTDRPRDLIETEIGQSATVAMAIEQFKDYPLAQSLLGWLQGSTNNTLMALINDHGPLGDQEENTVYGAFYDYTQGTEVTGGSLYLSAMLEESGTYDGYNNMSHKLMLVDHAYSDQSPAIIFTSGNYSDLGFTANDEVMLIFRGVPLVNKYYRGLDLTASMPPSQLDEPSDAKEFDQLLAMYPHYLSAESPMLRGFNSLPCGIVYGEVSNFRRTINVQDANGDLAEITVDLDFTIEGSLFFGGTLNPTAPFGPDDDPFIANEVINPDHRYMMVVPAGTMTLTTNVISDDQTSFGIFQPDEVTFDICPGGVRRVNLSVNLAGGQGVVGGGV